MCLPLLAAARFLGCWDALAPGVGLVPSPAVLFCLGLPREGASARLRSRTTAESANTWAGMVTPQTQ